MHAPYSKRLTLCGLVTLLAILPACGRRSASQLYTIGKSKIVAGSVVAAVATGAAVAGGSTVVEAGLGPVPITFELAHALYFLLPLAIIAAPIAIALIVSGNDDCREARKLRKQAKAEKKAAALRPAVEKKMVKYTYTKTTTELNAKPAHKVMHVQTT